MTSCGGLITLGCGGFGSPFGCGGLITKGLVLCFGCGGLITFGCGNFGFTFGFASNNLKGSPSGSDMKTDAKLKGSRRQWERLCQKGHNLHIHVCTCVHVYIYIYIYIGGGVRRLLLIAPFRPKSVHFHLAQKTHKMVFPWFQMCQPPFTQNSPKCRVLSRRNKKGVLPSSNTT